MIDLHTHTDASDGRCSPSDLVARAKQAGVTVLGVTDHDTVGGLAPAAAACSQAGIEFVPGIEVTAVVNEADVHVLGYFFDPASQALQAFLGEQRHRRVQRVRHIIERLAAHGISLDVEAILQPALADSTKSVGRPWIARALVARGHVRDVKEAFDRWLGRGCPAFVPRTGAAPEEVFGLIHAVRGVASLAHPLLVDHDEWIPAYAAAGLDALEAYHSDHEPADTERYLAMARDLNLAVTGGSDYHADDEHGGGGPGSVTLPREYYERLKDLSATRRATASGSLTSS